MILSLLVLFFLATAECTFQISWSLEGNGMLICNFTSASEASLDLSGLESLTISRRSAINHPFQRLVTASSCGPGDVKRADGYDWNAKAQIETDEVEGSYIMADLPDDPEGEYVCIAHAYDDLGHPVRLESNILAMTEQLLRDAFKENKYQALQLLREDALSRRKQFGSKVTAVSDIFNSSSFYIVTAYDLDFEDVENVCSDSMGFVAEINTESEYDFINEMLKAGLKGQTTNLVLLGALYQSVGAPIKAYTHPEDPLYLTDSVDNLSKHTSTAYRWLNLRQDRGNGNNWRMLTNGRPHHYRIGTFHTNRALCEVSMEYLDFETQQ